MMLLLILLLLAVVAGGGWGYSRWGLAGVSPAGAILLIVAVLYFTGNLHFA